MKQSNRFTGIILLKYSYRGIDEEGKKVSGLLDADSPEAASDMLLKKGYIPVSLRKKRSVSPAADISLLSRLLHPVSTRDLIVFTKQFRTMFRTGVPLLELFHILEKQTDNPNLQAAVRSMSRNVKEGHSLHDAFRNNSHIFSPLYCSVIHAGERSGALSDVLSRLSYILEHEERIKSDVKSALWYPAYVIGFLGVAFFVLLIFVIPKFVGIFRAQRLTLPMPTRICLYMYQAVDQYWYILLGGIFILIIFLYFYIKTETGKYQRDLLFIRLPLLGSLFIKGAMSRFASIFQILQYSGVSVLESMGILSDTIGNTAISREFDKIRQSIQQGNTIAETLRSARHFPPMVINMVAIGEKTEKLDEMLAEISAHYDAEVEYAMKGITESITPFLTIAIAFVVGFFALAIFLPMWDMTKIAR